jgi:hypothetical protein
MAELVVKIPLITGVAGVVISVINLRRSIKADKRAQDLAQQNRS